MIDTDMTVNHCPQCGCLCLLSQSAIAAEQDAGKTVAIACHQCHTQFGLDHNRPTGIKRARSAKMNLTTCPSCKKAISVPDPLPDHLIVDLFCPLCDSQIDQASLSQPAPPPLSAAPDPISRPADITTDSAAHPNRKNSVNRGPLYVLILACLIAYLLWAFETGQFPFDQLSIDQWLKILG